MIESGQRLGRRTVLKIGAAALVGATYEYLATPIKRRVDRDVTDITGHPSGDPREPLDQQNPQDLVVQSVSEEVVFRAIPANLVSLRDGTSPIKDIAVGDGKLGMSRRELIVGGLSALAYGAYHNISMGKNRIDVNTKNIPASPAVQGVGLWYLQRKLGFVSNLAANMLQKFKAF